MKERIGYVDAAKGLGMLLIMLGHITKYDNPVDLWMSSFKVVILYYVWLSDELHGICQKESVCQDLISGEKIRLPSCVRILFSDCVR